MASIEQKFPEESLLCVLMLICKAFHFKVSKGLATLTGGQTFKTFPSFDPLNTKSFDFKVLFCSGQELRSAFEIFWPLISFCEGSIH